MERDIPMGMNVEHQPLEIDIRKILEQLGIQKEKWPEEYKNPVQQS
jgi:signal recognition particle subunit SEC65